MPSLAVLARALAGDAGVASEPHPPAELVANRHEDGRPRRPCPRRALTIGRQRSSTDNHGSCPCPPSCRVSPPRAAPGCFPSSQYSWPGPRKQDPLVLLAAWAVDRRARRMGHHVRHGSDILSETWEHGRDADMGGNAFYLGQDLSWTSRSRHTKAAPEAGASGTAAQPGDAVPRSDDRSAGGVRDQGPEAASSQ
jgi:hypothetical protein